MRCKGGLEKHHQMERACLVKASRKRSRPKCAMGDDNKLSMNLGGPSALERDGDVRELRVSDTTICNNNDEEIVTTGGAGIDYQQREDKEFNTFDLEGGRREDGDGDDADDLYSCDSDSDNDSDK